jgi:hypothetical protein
MWTFNPASLAGKLFTHIRRGELWMTRARLTQQFADRRQQTAEGSR